MESIRVWIVSLGAVVMLSSAACALVPKNGAGKAVSLACAALVMAVLLSPIGKADIDVPDVFVDELSREIELSADKFHIENEKLTQDIIEYETEAYILQRAEDIGISCKVSVFSEENVPHSAEVRIKEGTPHEKLSEIIEAECGIPRERQMYKISEV